MTTKNVDIVVVGAGSAGIAASIAAANQGKHVLVLEKQAYGGGKATAAQVGTICGLFHQGYDHPKWLAKGYARRFAEKILKCAASKMLSSEEGLHFIHYSIDDFKTIVNNEFKENNVEVWYDAHVTETYSNDGCIYSIGILYDGNVIQVECRAVIDCSGQAVISELLGLEQITSPIYQAASRVFTLVGLADESEKRLSLTIWRAIGRAIQKGQIAENFKNIFVVQGSVYRGKASFKLTIPLPVSHTDDNLRLLNSLSVEMIHSFVNFLAQQNGFEYIQLHSIAEEVGVRTGPRPIGGVILTGEDVIGVKKFSDTIARSAWPVEKWSVDQQVQLHYLRKGEYYDIPSGCLQSKQVRNLFFAGRMISADEHAIASARVMGVCLQTGYAAGVLASCVIDEIDSSTAISLIQSKQILS